MTDLAVIMSVYKNDKLKFVKESVESILNQTFRDFHYYLVFDGPVSIDIENYVDSISDKRLYRYRLEKNEGLAKAMNFLLDKVMKNPQYEYIARMDADDISMPERFEKQRNYLLKTPEISIVGCWYHEIKEDGKSISERRLPVDHNALVKYYYLRAPFAHPSVIFRRKLIEKAGYYPIDTVLMEDNVLWGRSLKSGLMFGNIPEYMFKLRIDEGFFVRRSGIKYGWNFIITRLKINKLLKFPIIFSTLSVLIGIIKMMPSFLMKYFYKLNRKY